MSSNAETVETRTWYLAGPMSHIAQFNYPAFFCAANDLRNNHGLTVISPAEQDTKEKLDAILASPDGNLADISDVTGTWAEFLAHDVVLISEQVSGIIFMPDWQKSTGAKLEAYIGLLHGHDFAYYQAGVGMIAMTREDVLEEIYGALI